jgi:formate C-acetyltransferase
MHLQQVLGGTTVDGEDATNEFSFIMLDAAIAMHTATTGYVLRYHPKISPQLIDRAIDLIRTGVGYPSIFNDSAVILMLVNRGIPLEDAMGYTVRGCVMWIIPGKNSHNHRAASASLNCGKCLELALNQGVDMLTGKQLGCPTHDPATFTSLEDVKNAFFEQVKFMLEKYARIINLADDFYVRYMQLPFTSAVVDGCIERGQDTNSWTYHTRIAIHGTGNTNVADSLAAIQKFVFEDKRLTLVELVEALKSNFEGREELRQRLINEVPKFGNDDDYVDNIMRELQHKLQHLAEQHKSWWGDPMSFDGSIAGGYYMWGKRTAASADGRKARDSFADAVLSPMAGRDHQGPTAVIKSCGKVRPTWPFLTNQKFLPQFLEGENKKKFAAYLKTWADLGNYQIQFNVVAPDTLLDAQAHPENYTNLVVRVAGYSAYFVDLSKGIQDDIIARVSQQFG